MSFRESVSEPSRTDRPRRSWVLRLADVGVGALRSVGIPLGRLDPDLLLEVAQRRSRLTDFGDPAFREPFEVLVRSFDREARLSPVARVAIAEHLVRFLINRLCVEETVRRRPEIVESPIRRPLIIAALPRTGTTLLFNLLAQDPAARPLLAWESLEPAQRPWEVGRSRDPRIWRTVWECRLVLWIAPQLAAMHEINALGPEECSLMLYNTFTTFYPLLEADLPSFRDWYMAAFTVGNSRCSSPSGRLRDIGC
jgi:hypothetical protein